MYNKFITFVEPLYNLCTSTEHLIASDAPVQVKQYLFSLYNCQYSEFFTALGQLEQVIQAGWLSALSALSLGSLALDPLQCCSGTTHLNCCTGTFGVLAFSSS